MKRSIAIQFLLAALVGGMGVVGCLPGNTRMRPGGGDGGGGGEGCAVGCNRCDSNGNCLDCIPSRNFCSGNIVFACNADGTQGGVVKVCVPGQNCAAGDCISACEAAASTHSSTVARAPSPSSDVAPGCGA